MASRPRTPAGTAASELDANQSPQRWRRTRWQLEYARWQNCTKEAAKALGREQRLAGLLEDSQAAQSFLMGCGVPVPPPDGWRFPEIVCKTGDAVHAATWARDFELIKWVTSTQQLAVARRLIEESMLGKQHLEIVQGVVRLRDWTMFRAAGSELRARFPEACERAPDAALEFQRRLADAEQEDDAGGAVSSPAAEARREMAELRARLAELQEEELRYHSSQAPREEQLKIASMRSAQQKERLRLDMAQKQAQDRIASATETTEALLAIEDDEDRKMQVRQDALERKLLDVNSWAQRERLQADRELTARLEEEAELARLKARVESLPLQIEVARLATQAWRRDTAVSSKWGVLVELLLSHWNLRAFHVVVDVLEGRVAPQFQPWRAQLPADSALSALPGAAPVAAPATGAALSSEASWTWEVGPSSIGAAGGEDDYSGVALGSERMWQLEREMDRTVSEFVSSGFLDLVSQPGG